VDGRLAAAPEGPTVAPGAVQADAPERDLRALAAELRAICGDEWVYTQEHQLRTYESDGLLQYRAVPAAAVLPSSAEEVQRIVADLELGKPVKMTIVRDGQTKFLDVTIEEQPTDLTP